MAFTSTVSSDTPDGTVILVTVAITQANPFGVAWLDRLTNRAYADDSATTQARILVQSPPVDRTAAPTLTPTATATTAATTTATSTATGNSILPIPELAQLNNKFKLTN